MEQPGEKLVDTSLLYCRKLYCRKCHCRFQLHSLRQFCFNIDDVVGREDVVRSRFAELTEAYEGNDERTVGPHGALINYW